MRELAGLIGGIQARAAPVEEPGDPGHPPRPASPNPPTVSVGALTVTAMPKSRGRRKPAGKSQPRRRPTASPPTVGADGLVHGRYAVGRGSSVNKKIADLLLSDAAAPDLLVELLPALLWLEHARGHPRNLCVSACVTLHHTYAALGITAHPRAVDLVVANQRTDGRTFYGRPDPYWSDTTFHGHCVLWLPASKRFIDPTVEQYPEVRHYRLGPICGRMAAARITADQRAALSRGEMPAGTSIGVKRGELLLLYTTVDPEFDDVVLSSPVVVETRDDAERSGRNLASQALLLLNRPEIIDRARRAPHPRVRALLDVLAGVDGFVGDGDWRFTLPDGTTPRLDEITLPSAEAPAEGSPSAITTERPNPGTPETIHAAALDVGPPSRPRRRLLDVFRRRPLGPSS